MWDNVRETQGILKARSVKTRGYLQLVLFRMSKDTEPMCLRDIIIPPPQIDIPVSGLNRDNDLTDSSPVDSIHQSQSNNLINKDSKFSVGDWVIVEYSGVQYPGEVVLNVNNQYQVNVMHSDDRGQFKFADGTF